jgi:hypothetical protein
LRVNVFWMRGRPRKAPGRRGTTGLIRKVAQGGSLMMKVGAAVVDVDAACAAVVAEARVVAAAAALRVAEGGEREELAAAVAARGSSRGSLATPEREY